MINENKFRGYIKLYRSLADSNFWLREPFTRGQAWIDLLMLANHKDGYIRVRGNRIDVKRGQVGWSIKLLAKRWKWSRGKVQRFFDELEKIDKQIEQQKSSITTLISIINYKLYQSNGQQTGSRRTADGQQTDTNNNVKNDKECKEKILYIVGYLNEKAKKQFKPDTPKTDELIRLRLREGFTIEDFQKVIDIKCTQWLHDPKMSLYLRPITLFGTKFEGYLNEKPKERQLVL